MVTLTGKTPANTYKDLLQVSNSNSGIDATLRDVSDGEGTAGALKISTTGVASTGTHRFDGVASSDDTTESTSTVTGAIHTDGGLGVAKTIVAGLGIKLGGTAAANLLDDYEEGTFTATLATGATTTPTVTLNYTKIGNVAQIFAAALFGSHTNDGAGITITGFPFTASDRARFACAGPQRTAFSASENLYWELNGTTLSLIEIPPSSVTQTPVASSAVAQNPSYAEFNFVYQTT